MLAGWNEFAFFDAVPVRDPSEASSPLYSNPDTVSVVAGHDSAIMTTRKGTITEFSQDLEVTGSFSVCDDRAPDFVRTVPDSSLIVAVCSNLGHPVEISVWEGTGDNRNLHSCATVPCGTNTFPLTAFDMLPDLSVMVLGYADGSVVAVRGDLLHDRGTRHRLVYTASTGVTAVVLNNSGSQCFVASLRQILVVSTTAQKSTQVLERAKGAALNCAVPYRRNPIPGDTNEDKEKNKEVQLLVARDGEVALYNFHHRGPAFELVVPKRAVHVALNGKYLVVIANFSTSATSLLATDTRRLLILDLSNHLIAYNGSMDDARDVRAMFEQWDRINVIASNGIMYVLTEKPLAARVAALKVRNLFQVAIAMAKSEGDKQLALHLHQDFADYLFDKNDVDASLREYVAAIDLGQSSRAIRRFKDSQHARTLLKYLGQLYKRDHSSPQHVTLQIICYTKLGETAELRKFLEQVVHMENFDFEEAVSVLTEMHDRKHAELAAYVAQQWPDPDLAVQIMLRQLDDVQSTLDYIQTVSVADALRLLIQNSRVLLNRLPLETTGVLITLFTGKFITKEPKEPTNDFPKLSTEVSKTPVLQSYQAFISFLSSKSYLGSHIVSAETLEANIAEPSYLPPRPRLIFPSFIGHDNEFVIFLEACLQVASNFHSSEKDVSDIATTLFEQYLRVGAQDRAGTLVEQYADRLYAVRVLTTAETNQFPFTPKQLQLLGTLPPDVFRRFCDAEQFDTALEVLYENKDDKDLAMQAVRQLISSANAMASLREHDELEKVFTTALQSGMSPVQLVSMLSSSPHLTIGDVAPFIEHFLKQSADQTARHMRLAESYEAEIAEKRLQLRKQEEDLVVTYKECTQCQQPLDLPATHFGCKHSFHKHCLGSDETCPRCRPEAESLAVLRRQNAETAAQQEYFFEELGKKSDKVKVVMDFISRGALSEIH